MNRLAEEAAYFAAVDAGKESVQEEISDLRAQVAALTEQLAAAEREREAAIKALKRCAIVLAGEDMTKSALTNALEAARGVLRQLSPKADSCEQREGTCD